MTTAPCFSMNEAEQLRRDQSPALFLGRRSLHQRARKIRHDPGLLLGRPKIGLVIALLGPELEDTVRTHGFRPDQRVAPPARLVSEAGPVAVPDQRPGADRIAVVREATGRAANLTQQIRLHPRTWHQPRLSRPGGETKRASGSRPDGAVEPRRNEMDPRRTGSTATAVYRKQGFLQHVSKDAGACRNEVDADRRGLPGQAEREAP